MAQYYYDKFTAISNTYRADNAPWKTHPAGGFAKGSFSGQPSGYSHDGSSNTYTTAGSWAHGAPITPGASFFQPATNAQSIVRQVALQSGVAGYDSVDTTLEIKYASENSQNTTYSKGALVQAKIPAEDGTYPANGRHTDGYWYVKGAAVGPLGPGVITNSAYSKANFGDKITRLSNGWLVAAAKQDNTEIFLFKSMDGGVSWTPLCSVSQGATGSIGTYAIASDGTKVYVAVARSITNNTVNYTVFDALTVQNTRLTDYTTKQINNVTHATVTQIQIYVDPLTKFVHVAWIASSSGSSPTQNVYHSVSTNGGTTWSSTTMVTTAITTDGRYSYTNLGLTTDSKGFVTIFATSGIRLMPSNSSAAVYCVYVFKNNTTFGTTHMYVNSGWSFKIAYDPNSTSFIQTQVTGVKDKDGYFHATWLGYDTVINNIYNVFYGRSRDDGATWELVKRITNQSSGQHNYPTISVDKSNKVVITFAWQNPSQSSRYFVYQMVSTDRGSVFGAPTQVDGRLDANTQCPSVLYDPTFTVSFGDIAPIMYEQTTKGIYFKGNIITNNAPSVTITSPTNNQTLYENDTINISGDAYDADKDQSITVYYQINSEQRKVLATNLSQTQITLSKQLTFKNGKLYDGETVLTGTLAEGVAHTLKIWAVDSENEQSATIERTFYVVPNRAPLLFIDAVVPVGVIDSDKFKISGTSSDQDANSTVKVTKKLNANNPVEIYSGPGGAWEFDVSLAELVIGENTIVVEVIDNYGAKTSKTIKLKKNEVKTPILHAVARYKVTPPTGSAKGVLLFIERDEDMDLKVELSMTLAGEQEQYETLTADNTAPMPNTNGIVEDTYYHETTEPKDNIILKLSTTRPDATVNHKIHLISGAIE
ncbi:MULTISPECIES: Ig-like domain-containing protein [Lysinibacillus]|uniref:Ig-like domain-containing protein n=1 Tax=Lysinibacillus TaxID=400634 RepID=UPI00237D417C|nr:MULTISPECIES: Ig-like domain-containing protein [Lysinibacillus]WDU77506.1 Ig-like domain-containing protein [Lysinibacillus sp. G01H]